MRKNLLHLALGLYLAGSLLSWQPATAAPDDSARKFLAEQQLSHLAAALRPVELRAIGRALELPDRRLTDTTLGNLLRNPVAWSDKENSRVLLGTLLRGLRHVARVEGINSTMKLASHPDASNFRGFGTEIVSAAALNRFRGEGRGRAKMLRMGSMITCADGRERESDGAALFGADGIPRLVTIKSVSTVKAVRGSMKKAADQLALRNVQQDGSRAAGVIMVGYDTPEVLEKLQGKDWQAAANRSGAKLLVVAVDQRSGLSQKLASAMPDPTAQVQPKQLPPRVIPWAKQPGRPLRGLVPQMMVKPMGRAQQLR